MTDDATVIQGRLGWEPGDVSEADPAELNPHPKNREIYGDTDDVNDLDETFKESIAEKGVLEPLLITGSKKIISGHRRWLAARDAGHDEVPVRYSEFEDELAEREALVEFNRQREKTPGQIVNEFEEILAVEREKAKERNSKTAGGDPSRETFHETEKGRAKNKAAEKVNADVSGRTLEKGKTVKDKAESDDEPEAVREAAQDAWDGLQSGDESFHGAYEQVKQAEREAEERAERERRREQREQAYAAAAETTTLHHGEFESITETLEPDSVDAIITDPPYDADSLNVWSNLSNTAARVLKPGGFCIAYSGKAHLPTVLSNLGKQLTYHWQGVVVHNGPGAKIFSRNLRTGYKPVLIYANPPVEPQEAFVTDVIDGAGREKDDHDWQQAEGEAAALVERFTAVDDHVLDPMCGSGTVGVACQRLNRRATLIDRDAEAVAAAERRVNDGA